MPDYNDVPLGQAGTGAAYLLPQSQSASQLGKYLDESDDQDKSNSVAKLKHAQQVAANWKASDIKIKGGNLFQPEIAARTQKLLSMAQDMKKAGVDPINPDYTNPDAVKMADLYQNKRTELMQHADLRDSWQKQALEGQKLRESKPEGFYDTESIKGQHDALDGRYSLADIAKNNIQFPDLQERYDIHKNIFEKLAPAQAHTKVVKNGMEYEDVFPVHKDNLKNVQNAILNDPMAKANVERNIGMQIQDLPQTTDVNTVIKTLDSKYRSKPFQSELANKGVKSYEGEDYQNLLKKEATAQIDAQKKYDATVGAGADYLNSRVKPEHYATPNTTIENYKLRLRSQADSDARLALEKQRAQRETAKGNAAAAPTYYQDLSERMRTGVPGSGEEMNEMFRNNPAYLKSMHVDNTNPQSVKITVPAKYKTQVGQKDDPENKQSHRKLVNAETTYTLDSTNPDLWHSGMATIFKNALGEKTGEPAKLLTPYGKGKVPGGLQDPNNVQTTTHTVTSRTHSQSGSVTMVMPNGSAGSIPSDKVDAFLKKYPNAKRQ